MKSTTSKQKKSSITIKKTISKVSQTDKEIHKSKLKTKLPIQGDNQLEYSNNGEETLNAAYVGLQVEFAEAICELIKLEGSTVEGYKLAIKYIKNGKHKKILNLFLEQHKEHLAKLIILAREYNVAHINAQEDFENIFYTKMLILVGELILTKGDAPILQMLLNNEKDTNIAYERLLRHPAIWPESIEFIKKSFKDERSHQMKIIEMIALLGKI